MRKFLMLATMSMTMLSLMVTGCATGGSSGHSNGEHGEGGLSANGTANQTPGASSTATNSTASDASGSGNANSLADNSSSGQAAIGSATSGPIQAGPLNVSVTKTLSLTIPASGVNPGISVPAAAPNFLNSEQGFVVLQNAIMVTSDGGVTWRKISSPSGQVQAAHFASMNQGFLITSTASTAYGSPQTFHIYATTDGGVHWQQEWTSRPVTLSGSNRIFSWSTSKVVYAVVANQLVTSTDGHTWKSLNLPVAGAVADAEFLSGQIGFVALQQVDQPASARTAETNRLVVLQTSDGGRTWHQDLRTDSFSGNGAILAFGSTKNGMLLYKDTARMETDLYRTTDGGTTWAKSVPSAMEGRVFPGRPRFAPDGTVWMPLSAGAGPFASSVIESDNMGQTWHTVVSHGVWRNIDLSQRFGLTAYVLAGLSQGEALLKTTDGGKSWKQLLPSVEPSMGVSFLSSDIGYGLGTEANQDAILKTTDGGARWTAISSLPNGTQAYGMVFANSNVGYVLIQPTALSGGTGDTTVLETQNGGRTWTPATFAGLPSVILSRMQHSGDLVQPVYFYPGTTRGAAATGWVLGTTGYPKLYTIIPDGQGGSKVQGTFDDPPGAIEGYSFLSQSDGWMSVLTTEKSGTPGGQSVIQQLDPRTQSWETKWTLPPGWSVVGMDRLNANDAWLLAQKPFPSMNPATAVFRTTDGGRSWTEYEEPRGPYLSPPPTTGNSTFPFDFVNPNDGWLLTQNGLLVTTDGGATWKPLN